MRSIALVVLAACSEDVCPVYVSALVHEQGTVVSGRDFAGITWVAQVEDEAPEARGAILMPDGSLGPEVSLGDPEIGGTPGKTTMLWHPRVPGPFFLILQRGGETRHFGLSARARSSSVVFDGTSYQAFWLDGTTLSYCSISEDGVIGPPRMITTSAATIAAASDGAGQTLLRLGNEVYFVLPDGTRQKIVDELVPEGNEVGPAFYFAGEYHILVNRAGLTSITPTGTKRGRSLPHVPSSFYVHGDSLFLTTMISVVELDPSLVVKHEELVSFFGAAGVLGRDVIRIRRREMNPMTLEPGKLFVDSPTWRVELATDSEVRRIEPTSCEP